MSCHTLLSGLVDECSLLKRIIRDDFNTTTRTSSLGSRNSVNRNTVNASTPSVVAAYGCVGFVRACVCVILVLSICVIPPTLADHTQPLDVIVDNMTFCNARLDYYYIDPRTKSLRRTSGVLARYGASSACESSDGEVVHVEDEDSKHTGCSPHAGKPPPPRRKWIALVQRGHCQFDHKIKLATHSSNASAIVVYNNRHESDIPIMYHMVSNTIAVFIHKEDGDALAALVDAGVDVHLNIRVHSRSASLGHQGHGTAEDAHGHSPNKQMSRGLGDAASNSGMLLYVSLSLVILVIGGLGALLVFGLYRTRNANRRGGGVGGAGHSNGVARHVNGHVQATRVVYSETGELRGYLVEQPLTTISQGRPYRAPRRAPPLPRSVYTTIVEEDEDEEET